MQSWQHHIEPVGMIMPIVFGVFAKRSLKHAISFEITLVVCIAHTVSIFFTRFTKFIGINKTVIARVIRRVYKNAVFDTNRKSLLRYISAEKGLK